MTAHPKSELKEEITIPEKRTQFTYMQQAKDRKAEQKKILRQIEEDNKNKLKKVQEKPQS